MKPYPPIGYSEYLRIPELLSLQKLRSEQLTNRQAHDEMLFIITHQTYELWFKQILTELDSVLAIFRQPRIDEVEMGTAVARLQRITEIQKLLIQQISVLETMTPLDFLDFRDMLYPASGFQSFQNRLIENKLGLKPEQRLAFNSMPYHAYVGPKEQELLLSTQNEESLFELVDKWLARTPFLQTGEFDFWTHYRDAVERLLAEDLDVIRNHPQLSAEAKEQNVRELEATRETFRSLFDRDRYEDLRKEGLFRFSYEAIHAALLIQLYRNEPAFTLPFQLLTALQDIDELMTTWRYRHALMAHRMLGRKIGTGGSSGARYLKDATEKHRIFNDLFNLATFLVPRSRLPELPQSVREKLGFFYTAKAAGSN